MELNIKWLIGGLLLVIVSLISFIVFFMFPQGRAQETTEVEIVVATSTYTVPEGVKAIIKKYAYGPGVEIISADENKILFKKPHETEGCNTYGSLDLKTGEETATNLRACPKIPVADSFPFYIEDCTYAECYDFKTLYVTNVLTMERKAVHIVATTSETTIADCHDSTYDPICTSSIEYYNGILIIPIYKSVERKPFEVYKNEGIRKEEVNLYDVFTIEHPKT